MHISDSVTSDQPGVYRGDILFSENQIKPDPSLGKFGSVIATMDRAAIEAPVNRKTRGSSVPALQP